MPGADQAPTLTSTLIGAAYAAGTTRQGRRRDPHTLKKKSPCLPALARFARAAASNAVDEPLAQRGQLATAVG